MPMELTALPPAATGLPATRPITPDGATDGATPDRSGLNLWGSDGFGFGDLLDILNPLQHVPVISTLYRKLTGDEIGNAARVAGGALFGGPIGLIGALMNAMVERSSGQDLGETLIALVSPSEGDPKEAIIAQSGVTSEPPVTVATAAVTPLYGGFAALRPAEIPSVWRGPLGTLSTPSFRNRNEENSPREEPLRNRNDSRNAPDRASVVAAMSAALDRYRTSARLNSPASGAVADLWR